MPYSFNPHRHVKIWFSKNKDSFLNYENQMRLIKMRAINREDEINFVFDSRLLSASAIIELTEFCKKYNIKAMNMSTDVIPYCSTEEEKKLIELYDNEINAIENGGNLAVASDIARWLEPVYKSGTYTDFDVFIDTRELPQEVEVKHALVVYQNC